ncbi:lytic transglycosylase domain-containing protein [Hydrogenophaga pseudoflava]|nr:lytic transglycosylase domain-containing protein [Hydrogenophaga pseudoflava]
MSISADALTALLLACAPAVHPDTGAAIVRHESGGELWALGVNGGKVKPQPRTAAQAAAAARVWIAAGVTVDLGLAQINSRTAARLGFTVEQVLDPCTNLRAMQQVMVENYRAGAALRGQGQGGLEAALSTYNTGSPTRGLSNGYVGKVLSKAGEKK